jgi:acetyltransferase-like isoleucine patch superfamily enzyme
MKILNIFQKWKSLIKYIRGWLFKNLLIDSKIKNLRISNNVEIWGNIQLGNNIYIGSGVKIYSKNIINNNVYLGDNVELRCNGGNKIEIGQKSTINRGSMIIGNVKIGNNCLIAPLCVVVGSNHNFSQVDKNINQQGLTSKGVVIESNVWLGTQVTVLDGVTIEENSIIGAGSVVTKNIPKNSIAVGNPCIVIKTRVLYELAK